MLLKFNLIFFASPLLLLLQLMDQAHAHARLLNPPARSSAWRYDLRFPIEYNDNEMFCGGINKQWVINGLYEGIVESFLKLKH